MAPHTAMAISARLLLCVLGMMTMLYECKQTLEASFCPRITIRESLELGSLDQLSADIVAVWKGQGTEHPKSHRRGLRYSVPSGYRPTNTGCHVLLRRRLTAMMIDDRTARHLLPPFYGPVP
ncbi:hypothetical protein V8F33_008914 [Rhypophila sp. PSN 637]